LFKIDKSTWEKMRSNNSEIIKQWIPEPHKISQDSAQEVFDVQTDASENFRYQEINASVQKEEIIKLALKEAEEIKKSAYQEGYNYGLRKAQNKFADICEEQNGQLSSILQEIEDSKKHYDDELEDKSLKLSISIAEKILNMKLENDDKIFVGMVRSTLAMMDKGEKFTLKLNKREYEKHYKNRCEALQKELQCDVPVTVVKDVSLKAGGLIIESEESFVDAGIGTQLERIANSLTNSDKQYHEAL